ncbi:MAG: SAM-dependent chlorinase/fluorinase [Rhodothermales bacterium]
MNRILTLTTDFGVRDAYVASMKGVILGLAPEARLIDITHSIRAHDIMEAAFVLRNAVDFFPAGTVHLAVVDPGVGSDRRPVALRAGDRWFVGPDNGLFSLVLTDRTIDERVVLDRPAYWRTPAPSHTFHGRDIFAPAAAHILRGTPLRDLGTPIEALKPLHWALPIDDQQGIQGWVVHVDRFGNCVTNISRALFDDRRKDRSVKCYIGSTIIDGVACTYSDAQAGEPLMLFESSNHLEIAVNNGNAAELLGIRKGGSVNVVFIDERT